MHLATAWGKSVWERQTDAIAPTASFNLLRWFSISLNVRFRPISAGRDRQKSTQSCRREPAETGQERTVDTVMANG